jgi:hypothetical protein
MTKYIATCQHTQKQIEVEAEDIHAAAKKAAGKLNASRGFSRLSLGAHRETGEPGMSGCFQAYTSGNPQTAVGYLFHMREA